MENSKDSITQINEYLDWLETRTDNHDLVTAMHYAKRGVEKCRNYLIYHLGVILGVDKGLIAKELDKRCKKADRLDEARISRIVEDVTRKVIKSKILNEC